MAKLERLRTPKVRLAFPVLFTPESRSEGGEPEFSAMLLLDKEAQQSKEFKVLKAKIMEMIKEKWGPKPPKGLHIPFKKGEDLQNNTDGEYYGGCDENTLAINVHSKFAPEVLNQKKHLMRAGVPEEEAQIYAGCYVLASITPKDFVFKNEKGQLMKQGITLYLGNVMKVAEGDPLGGRVSASQDFDDVETVEVDTDGLDEDLNMEGVGVETEDEVDLETVNF
jgi:hypothetical protein